jgi:hypothetical protein
MSTAFYSRLKSTGRGPRETVVDGLLLILSADEAAWDAAMSNPTGDEAERVAAKRAKWHERSLKAGAAAAKSAEHVSKLKLGRSKRPPPRARRSR